MSSSRGTTANNLLKKELSSKAQDEKEALMFIQTKALRMFGVHGENPEKPISSSYSPLSSGFPFHGNGLSVLHFFGLSSSLQVLTGNSLLVLLYSTPLRYISTHWQKFDLDNDT